MCWGVAERGLTDLKHILTNDIKKRTPLTMSGYVTDRWEGNFNDIEEYGLHSTTSYDIKSLYSTLDKFPRKLAQTDNPTPQ